MSTLNVTEASALQAATDELIAKRKKCDGSVIVAQKSGNLVGFALVNDDVLETVAVAVDERGRGVGAQLVDAAGALASSGGNDELLVEVEPQNGRGRNFFEGLGFESTGERRGTLAVLSKPLPWRPPALVVSVVIGLPLVVALAGVAVSGDVSQLDLEGALAALGGRAALVCGARKDQTTFAERFAMCDGAMEWYPGGFSADPGFYVPSAVNRRGGV